jgi:hypothetical protein
MQIRPLNVVETARYNESPGYESQMNRIVDRESERLNATMELRDCWGRVLYVCEAPKKQLTI